MERIINADRGSGGTAEAPALLFDSPDFVPDCFSCGESGSAETEWKKFLNARDRVSDEFAPYARENEVFLAYQVMLEDPDLLDSVKRKINAEGASALSAVTESFGDFAASFKNMEDAYMRERAADVSDVGRHLQAELSGKKLPDPSGIETPCIVICGDFYASDVIKMNPVFVKGILSEKGSPVSHAYLLAKDLGIPVITGVKDLLQKVTQGEKVGMNAETGEIRLFKSGC